MRYGSCARCGAPMEFSREVNYNYDRKGNYVTIEWFFCSEECYEKWLERQIRIGRVKPKSEVIIFS